MADLSLDILGMHFANPFMNAAGVCCSTVDDLSDMLASDSGSIITKSCTLEERAGNPEPRYHVAPYGSINSMGLPNKGFDYYFDFVSSAKQQQQRGQEEQRQAATTMTKKPIFFSMSGMTLEENVKMCEKLAPLGACGALLLELNLSCPNVPGKPQVGYDWDTMGHYLEAVSAAYRITTPTPSSSSSSTTTSSGGVPIPFGVKLPPYMDMSHFDQAASVLNKFPNVAFLTCINSIGNGLLVDVDTETALIKPKDGFGGIGGRYVLPTALANVNAFYRRCPDKIINGCGGVTSGQEAFMHVLAGAHMVQIGTQLHEDGSAVFARVLGEFTELMGRKGYTTLAECRGKLKTL